MVQKLIVILFILGHYAQAQVSNKALSSEQIIKLIPGKIKEFYADSDSKSKIIKLGNIQYSMAEKNFAATRKRSIKILLFDYIEAPVMYKQATRDWNTYTTIDTDSLLRRPAEIDNCSGWESYNVRKRNSQILLGICDRFFLTIEGTGVELEVLQAVVQQFKFDTFPK